MGLSRAMREKEEPPGNRPIKSVVMERNDAMLAVVGDLANEPNIFSSSRCTSWVVIVHTYTYNTKNRYLKSEKRAKKWWNGIQ